MTKKQIGSAKKKFHYEQLFNMDRFYIFPFYFADISLTSSIKNVIGGNLTDIFVEFNNDHADYYADIKEVNTLGKNLFNRILNDEKYYKKTAEKILSYGEKLLRFCQQINKIKISKLTNRQFYNLYHQYGKLITKMRDWGWVPVVLDGIKISYLSNYLIKQLNKILRAEGFSRQEIPQYYSVLTSSEKKSEVAQEEIARLNLLLKILKESPDFKKLFKEKDNEKLVLLIKNQYSPIYRELKRHAEDFGWLTFYYIGPPMSVVDLIKTINPRWRDLSENLCS